MSIEEEIEEEVDESKAVLKELIAEKRIFEILLIIVLIFCSVVVGGLFSFYLITSSNNVGFIKTLEIDHDSKGGVQDTGSMKPTLDYQDEIYYSTDFEIKVGDMYVYKKENEGYTILHRLVYRDGDWCFFKGDNNYYIDTKVNCSKIVKRVVGVEYG